MKDFKIERFGSREVGSWEVGSKDVGSSIETFLLLSLISNLLLLASWFSFLGSWFLSLVVLRVFPLLCHQESSSLSSERHNLKNWNFKLGRFCSLSGKIKTMVLLMR